MHRKTKGMAQLNGGRETMNLIGVFIQQYDCFVPGFLARIRHQMAAKEVRSEPTNTKPTPNKLPRVLRDVGFACLIALVS